MPNTQKCVFPYPCARIMLATLKEGSKQESGQTKDYSIVANLLYGSF